MRKTKPFRWGCATAGLIFIAALVPAQAHGGSPEVVEELKIPVQVTRRDQPVRGLTVNDFGVFRGGERQPITGFEVVDLALVHSSADPLSIAGRRQFIFLFDFASSSSEAITSARAATRELLLHRLRPGDLAGVVTYSALLGMRLVLGLTSDRKQIAAAIDSLGGSSSSNGDPLRLVFEKKEREEGGRRQEFGDWSQERVANPAANEDSMIRSYSEFARMLGAIPGRKQIFYFSEGFDNSASDLEHVTEELRRADCVIHSVYLGDLHANNEQEIEIRQGAKQSLLAMALGTGGELYRDINGLAAAMSGLLERTSLTYILSIRPEASKVAGAYSDLRVQYWNAPQDIQITHRAGYYTPKPFAQLSPMERLLESSARLLGGKASGPIPTAILTAPFRGAGDRAYVPVLIEVNGPGLLGDKPQRILPVEIYIYALDSDGGVQDFLVQKVGLDLAKLEPALRRSGLKFFGHLDLPVGEYSIRILVNSGTTGVYSLRVAPLTVPALGKGPVLLPPFFPEAPDHWVLVRESQPNSQVPYPFVVKERPFIPSSRPVLADGQEATLALMGYNLGSGTLKAETQILAQGREVGTGEIRNLERQGDGEMSFMTAIFNPPKLPPGDYVLWVTVSSNGGTHSSSNGSFVISGEATHPESDQPAKSSWNGGEQTEGMRKARLEKLEPIFHQTVARISQDFARRINELGAAERGHVYSSSRVLVLLDETQIELHRSLEDREFAAFKDYADYLLDETRRQIHLGSNSPKSASQISAASFPAGHYMRVLFGTAPETASRESAAEIPIKTANRYLGNLAEKLNELIGQRFRQRLHVQTEPDRAKFTMYPPSYKADMMDPIATNSSYCYVPLGRYSYKVEKDGYETVAYSINVVSGSQEVLECVLQARGAKIIMPCSMKEGKAKDCS